MTFKAQRRAQACLWAAIGAICAARAVAADDSSWVVTEEAARALHVCLGENDGARRLECYDKALSRSSAAGHATQTTPEQRFGLSAAEVVKKEHLAESPRNITAKVTAVGREPAGNLKVTLDNGQVWAQQNADGQELPVSVGDSVSVSHEMMGGFLLTSSAGGHRSMRVRRVK
jgi:hypothetical protein